MLKVNKSKAIVRKFYQMMGICDSGWVDEIVATNLDRHSAVPDLRVDIELIALSSNNLTCI